MSNENRYWFPAKRYGWGWGPPNCWQGWTVLSGWLALFFTVTRLFARNQGAAYWLSVIAMLGLLLAICYAKGEPLAWRWGDRK